MITGGFFTIEDEAVVGLEDSTACAGIVAEGTSGERGDVGKLLAVGGRVGGSVEKTASLRRAPWRNRISSEKDASENPFYLALFQNWRS